MCACAPEQCKSVWEIQCASSNSWYAPETLRILNYQKVKILMLKQIKAWINIQRTLWLPSRLHYCIWKFLRGWSAVLSLGGESDDDRAKLSPPIIYLYISYKLFTVPLCSSRSLSPAPPPGSPRRSSAPSPARASGPAGCSRSLCPPSSCACGCVRRAGRAAWPDGPGTRKAARDLKKTNQFCFPDYSSLWVTKAALAADADLGMDKATK